MNMTDATITVTISQSPTITTSVEGVGGVGPAGTDGVDGSTGATGPTGATGASYHWLGDWETATEYSANDCVNYNGNGYVCLIDHTSGTFATDLGNGDWSLFVQQGPTGPTGPTGPIGADVDFLYGTDTSGPTGASDGSLYLTYIP